MALSPDEDAVIYEALVGHLRFVEAPRTTILAELDNLLSQRFPVGALLLGELVRSSINLCANDGSRLDPTALVRLLQLIEYRDPMIPSLISRLTRPTAAGGGASGFDDTVLEWQAPFLDRAKLRRSLQALLEPRPLKPFVVVNGPRNHGRTYTSDFISHVLRDHLDVMACIVPPLAETEGASVGPAELARAIVSRIGGVRGPEPPPLTNLDRWYEELVNWMTEPTPYRWWIVLDGFNANELRPDTRGLIGKLAVRLRNGYAQQQFRLILLDFDGAALPVPTGTIADDQTNGVSAASVEQFVNSLFAATTDHQERDAVAAQVLDGLGDPVSDLPTLNERLTCLIQLGGAPR